MMVMLYMLDGTIVKIMSVNKSAQRIVCYFIIDIWALAEQ